jgi:hypothetical protein
METNDSLEQKTLTLEVTENAKAYLKTASSWTNFYAIMSFIGIGCYVLYAILMFTTNGIMSQSQVNMPFSGFSTLMGLFMLIIAIVQIFPALFLLWFSQKTKKALQEENTYALEEALQNLKSYWKFIGIVTIVGIAFAIIVIPITVIMSMSYLF